MTLGSVRDSEWKRLRTVMSPTFTTGKLKRMTPLILECVDTMNDNIDKIIARNEGQLSAPVDMKRIAGAYVMESIIQVAFGRKVSALIEPNNPIIENIRKIFSTSLFKSVKVMAIKLTPNVAKMLKISTFDRKVMQFFRDLTLTLIDDRKHCLETGSPVKRADFLQLLLDSMRDNNNEAIDGSEEYTDSKSAEKYREIQPTDDMTDKSEI
jgi:cytochrome P450